MGKRTSYAPATFSWVDLAASDADGAKVFYASLFGWEMEDAAVGGGAYTTCRLDGDAVCGIFAMTEEMRASGAAPSWTSYVTVEDADAAVARATQLGGAATAGTFDVLGAGRTALLRDPQGAAFAVWQPGSRIGAERVNDIGCLCMNELATTDLDAARSFYGELFGWRTEVVEDDLVFAYNGETLNASFTTVRGDASAHWRPYFTVESTARSAERVGELGGTVVLGPVDHPDGSIAMALDPQGALFALFEGEVDP